MGVKLETIIENPTLEFEISGYDGELDDIIKAVEKKYPEYKFVATEPRYLSCVIAIFERR